MGGVELSFGQVVEPLPVFAAVPGGVHTGDRGEDLPIRPCRIYLYAVGADVGSYFILRSVQKKLRMGDSLDGVRTDRLVDSPAGGEMKTSGGGHGVDR